MSPAGRRQWRPGRTDPLSATRLRLISTPPAGSRSAKLFFRSDSIVFRPWSRPILSASDPRDGFFSASGRAAGPRTQQWSLWFLIFKGVDGITFTDLQRPRKSLLCQLSPCCCSLALGCSVIASLSIADSYYHDVSAHFLFSARTSLNS